MVKKNVLITGGAGFIGSNLALGLIEKGHVVTVLDNLSGQVHGNGQDSSSYCSIKDQVRFIKGDVRHRSAWMEAIEGQSVVVHLAAETGTGQSMYEIEKYVDVNVRGTALLLDILTNGTHSIKKIILASSRAVYGEGKYFCSEHKSIYPDGRRDSDMCKGDFEPKCPICNRIARVLSTDETSCIHPASIYGSTKQMQEQLVLMSARSLHIPSVIFRYQNVYGPGQSLLNPYTGILSIFSTCIKNGNNIMIFEDGKESRDFVYIEDVVNATILGIYKKEADFKIFNVGSGVKTNILTIAETLKRRYRSDVDIKINGKYRMGDIRHNYADLTKIGNELGFEPKYDFETGIANFVDWVKEQEIGNDSYDKSILEMKKRGLLRKSSDSSKT